MKKLVKKHTKILKKILFAKLILTVYLLVSILIVPEIDSVDAKTIYGAHRGASVDYEENTIEAFEHAVKDEKYKFIEFDISYSKDGEIVVFHKNTRFRRPKKGVSMTDLTYEELNSKFEFEIPIYKGVMDVISGKKPVNIEIKSHGDLEQDIELVEFVIQDCKDRGIFDQIMISAISRDIIEYIEEKHPEIRTGKIYFVTKRSLIPIADICDDVYDTSADYILLHGYNLYNYETLIKCKPEDKTLIFWYFTDEVYIIDHGNDCLFWMNC